MGVTGMVCAEDALNDDINADKTKVTVGVTVGISVGEVRITSGDVEWLGATSDDAEEGDCDGKEEVNSTSGNREVLELGASSVSVYAGSLNEEKGASTVE